MMIRSRPSVLHLLIAMRGSLLPTIAPRIVLVAVWSAIVAFLQQHIPQHFPELTLVSVTLIGLALSICLGFHTNAGGDCNLVPPPPRRSPKLCCCAEQSGCSACCYH